jgi:dipeptidyl aminopeptidase/acylaminoacyl peptidase
MVGGSLAPIAGGFVMARIRLGRRGFMVASGAALSARGASAQPAPSLIPRRLLFAAPERARVTISPDGKLIAFLGPVDGILNVWLAPVADPAAARPLTRITDRDVRYGLWWPHDNRHIVFFREQGGDENWQAHRIDIVTGDIRALTPSPGVLSFVKQASARFPGELLLSHNQRDKRYFDIYRVNVATGESTLVYQNDSFAWVFTDPQFRVRWGGRYRTDGGWDVVKLDGEGAGSLFRRVEPDDAYTTSMVEIGDDGKELYWLDSQGRDRAAVVAQDLATGKFRVMAEDAQADFGEPVLDPVSCAPIAAAVVYGKRRWQAIDQAATADLERIVGSGEGELGGFGVSDDRSSWVGYAEPADAPGRFFHYDRASGRVRRLFSSRPALESAPLVPMRPVVVAARDGLKLVCYLSRPRDAVAGQPGPMVLLVHGGPWFRDYPDFNTTHQWLANRGYSVLSVNFRGSTGFGKAFINAADREWAGKMHDDLIDAVDWAITQRIADPARVGIYGASYGGYSALVGATFTPEKFACAVDLFGISDLVSFANAMPPYWRTWAPVLKARMGDHTTAEGREFLASRSPLTHVDRIVRPLLIGQGGNDVRVVVAESDQIVAEMQRRSTPVTYVYYNDEGHGFRRPENRRSFTAVVEAFLAQHLGGSCEPVGEDFAGSSIEFRAGRNLIPSLG